MALVGIEAVIDAVQDVLKAALPDKLAALNAEYDDAYALADIADSSWYDCVPDLHAASFEYPAVVILDEEDAALSEQSNFDLYVARYQIIVDVLVRGQDARELTRKLWRYERAIKEILVQRHSLAPTCTACDWLATDNTVLTDPASGDLLQDRAARFSVLTAETTS